MRISTRWLVLGACMGICSAHAAPSGRSAKMAARLKKHPTSSWLAHYLPDDRYKIAGGIWKYVSTDLDTYYHRPNSPNMLRQSADRVIGFASSSEAEEAGYRPDGSIANYAPPGAALLNKTKLGASQRIVLSDKKSSVILPKGWKRGGSESKNSQYSFVTSDKLITPKGQTVNITIELDRQANVVDYGKIENLEGVVSFEKALSNTLEKADVSLQPSQLAKINTVTGSSRFKINGMQGIKTVNASPEAGVPARSYSFGFGRKILTFNDFTDGRTNLTPLVKSLQLR